MTHFPNPGHNPNDLPDKNRDHANDDASKDVSKAAKQSLPISIEQITARFMPAELSLSGISEDAAADILELFITDETGMYSIDSNCLLELLIQTRNGTALGQEALATFAPSEDSLAIRQVTRIMVKDGVLLQERTLELERLRDSRFPSPILNLTLSQDGKSVSMNISWAAALLLQTQEVFDERWADVDIIVEIIEKHPLEQADLKLNDGSPAKLEIDKRASLSLVELDPLRIEPIANPHLSIDPSFIDVCALRPKNCEANSESTVMRLQSLQQKLASAANIYLPIADITKSGQFEYALADLEALSTEEILDSDQLFKVLWVDGYLLLATKDATGESLIADLEELQSYERQRSMQSGAMRSSITAIEIADPTIVQLNELLQTCSFSSSRKMTEWITTSLKVESISKSDEINHDFLKALSFAKGSTLTVSENYTLFIAENSAAEDGPPPVVIHSRKLTIAGNRKDPFHQVPTIILYQHDTESPFMPVSIETDPELTTNDGFFVNVSCAPIYAESGTSAVMPRRLCQTVLASLGIEPNTRELEETEGQTADSSKCSYLTASVRVFV